MQMEGSTDDTTLIAKSGAEFVWCSGWLARLSISAVQKLLHVLEIQGPTQSSDVLVEEVYCRSQDVVFHHQGQVADKLRGS